MCWIFWLTAVIAVCPRNILHVRDVIILEFPFLCL